MKIFDEIGREFGVYTLVSSEELVDEGPDSVTVTLPCALKRILPEKPSSAVLHEKTLKICRT